MTKKWSATASGDGKTKRRASKAARHEAGHEIEQWLTNQGAVESVKFDEDTGAPVRVFTIKL